MRTPEEVRDELARCIMHFAAIEQKNSLHARAAFERIRVLEWVLETTEVPLPDPDGDNGAASE